jgi:hypothetical protein
MRFMLTFRIPPEEGTAAAKDGRIGDILQSILEDLKPEAAYFAEIEGARGGYLVVNMDDPSQMPAIFEPFLLGLGATVQMHPTFTPDDMPRVTEAIEQAVRKYG